MMIFLAKIANFHQIYRKDVNRLACDPDTDRDPGEIAKVTTWTPVS
jgi:hypothetical protein